jgi:nucleoside-diphosphate-sugar epimerase
MKRVIVTGGTGKVGRACVEELLMCYTPERKTVLSRRLPSPHLKKSPMFTLIMQSHYYFRILKELQSRLTWEI